MYPDGLTELDGVLARASRQNDATRTTISYRLTKSAQGSLVELQHALIPDNLDQIYLQVLKIEAGKSRMPYPVETAEISSLLHQVSNRQIS